MNVQNSSNNELLSALVGKGNAKKLIAVPLSILFGVRARRQEVCEDPAQYSIISVAKELVTRAMAEEIQTNSISLSSPQTVKDYIRLVLGGREQEVFMVLFLDAQNKLIASEEMFHGTLTQTSVYPREVLKRALAHNANSVILAHNHPSGLAEPSRSDETLTNALKDALSHIDVRILDHIIIGDQTTTSFAERGLV